MDRLIERIRSPSRTLTSESIITSAEASLRLQGPTVPRIVKFLSINTLDFTSEDIEFLKGRTLGWYRLQVRRADGWHYAYPPDWTYAPLARSCACGK